MSDELISKQAVLDALLAKMDEIDDKPEVVLGMAVVMGMIKAMPSALEQEPCDDCISREAAICLADELKDDLPDDDRLSDMVMSHNEGILEYQTQLSLLPPVQPKQRTGRWIMHIDDLFPAESTMECNKCHEHQPITIDDNYCPNCGAKMQEVEE